MNYLVVRRVLLIALSAFCAIASVTGLVCASAHIYRENQPVYSQPQEEKVVEILLPIMLPDSCVVAERIVSYSGTFVEDGTGREVDNIAALRIYNAGVKMLPFFRITVVIQGQMLQFEGSCLPPGSVMLLQEINANCYLTGKITFASIHIYDGSCWEGDGEFIECETFEGGIKVHNTAQQLLDAVYIYHKNYLQEENMYLGGVTYITVVSDLQAGEMRNIWPAHWNGDNRFVCIDINSGAQ